MDTKYVEDFKRNVNSDIFKICQKGYTFCETIREQEENTNQEYSLRIKYQVCDNQAVFLRLEDLKEHANYLMNGKRNPGKDNDFTIIDTKIFQFEIKKAKSMGGHHVSQQFNGGKKWLQHLLPLVSEDYQNIYEIFNIYIHIPNGRQRGTTRSSGGYRICYKQSEKENYITIELDDFRIKSISLDKVINCILSGKFTVSDKLI